SIVTSVYVSDDTGRQVLLEHTGDRWANRLSDVAKLGARRRQISWTEGGGPARDEWMPGQYDPRSRPWYIGALSLARDSDFYWSDPYIFFTTKEPGITASMKWSEAGAVRIIAFDVKLLSLSRFISRLTIG